MQDENFEYETWIDQMEQDWAVAMGLDETDRVIPKDRWPYYGDTMYEEPEYYDSREEARESQEIPPPCHNDSDLYDSVSIPVEDDPDYDLDDSVEYWLDRLRFIDGDDYYGPMDEELEDYYGSEDDADEQT